MANVFEKIIKFSEKELGLNPLYSVSLPGIYSMWFKTDIKLQTRDLDLIQLIENNIRGGISSVMGDRYVKLADTKKIFYIDANNLYGWAKSQYSPYDDIRFDCKVSIETI